MNSIGERLRLTTFGESHGKAIGGILDGLPAQFRIDRDHVQRFLDLRRPGTSALTSPRLETDRIEFLSGLDASDYTTGAPIAFIIPNKDTRPKDYNNLLEAFRPSHADYTYHIKYGAHGQTGGGRASARETAVRCAAGAMALQWLEQNYGVKLSTYVSQVGPYTLPTDLGFIPQEEIYSYPSRCPHPDTNAQIEDYIKRLKREGDSSGGVVTCIATGVPVGWGEPLYDKMHARLASALMSINAAKGFEVGDGFAFASMRGSEANDSMGIDIAGQPIFRSNHSGGIQGGISNGAPIRLKVAFKPTPTIAQEQKTITHDGEETQIRAHGRHDPCLTLRAVPVVEAMTAITLCDLALQAQCHRNTIHRV